MTFKEYFNNSNILLLLIVSNVVIAAAIGVAALFPAPAQSLMVAGLVLPAEWGVFITRPWTLLSYMFTQISFLHLLFNMLWLLWFGRIFIYCSSEKKFLLTYILGGLTGGLLFLAACGLGNPLPGTFLTGASASVLAVMTAASVMAPNLELRLFLLGGIRLKYVALLCIVLTFLGIGGGNAGSFSAHFGGVIFGLFAPSLLVGRKWKLSRWETPALFKKMMNKLRARRMRVPDALRHNEESRNTAPHKRFSAASYNPKSQLSDEERLDQLLDKVRVSGYDSLSQAEKSELNAISSRL